MRALIIIILSMPTWLLAQAQVDVLNSKADELELSQEVEDFELLGEEEAQQQAQLEAERLMQETRQLERDIKNMQRQNTKAQAKSKRLAAIYQQKANMAAKITKQAQAAEKRRNASQKRVDNLERQVKNKETQAIKAVERRKTADQEYAKLERIQKSLKKRLKVAGQVIERNDKRRLNKQKQIRRLSKANDKLNRQVVRAEQKAIQSRKGI
jgi:colicin import membrane protein